MIDFLPSVSLPSLAVGQTLPPLEPIKKTVPQNQGIFGNVIQGKIDEIKKQFTGEIDQAGQDLKAIGGSLLVNLLLGAGIIVLVGVGLSGIGVPVPGVPVSGGGKSESV